MKTRFRLCLAVLALAAWPAVLPAASIGVNYGNTVNGTLSPADVAGVPLYAQSNYNDVTAAATNRPLNDNTGAATTATLTTTGTVQFGSLSATVSGPDEILNNTRAAGVGTTWSFTLNSIPYEAYSIVVYAMELNLGTVKGIGVGGTTFYTSSPRYNDPGYIDGNPDTPFTYTQSTSTNPAAPTLLSNYVVFTGLSGGTQTVTITGANSNLRIGGFQIVQVVPEPSTWALALVGGVCTVFVLLDSRRKRRS